MKFCYNTNFTLPQQSQRSRSILQDGSRYLGLFWKGKILSYNLRNTVIVYLKIVDSGVSFDMCSRSLFIAVLCQNIKHA